MLMHAKSKLSQCSRTVYTTYVLCILVLAAGLRFWKIGSKPGYDWDETVYTNVTSNLVHGNRLIFKPQYGLQPEPYLFHPPFYFEALGLWERVAGVGITQARIFAATASMVVLVLLFLFLQTVIGRSALFGLAFLAVDGWLVYSNRMSWIENSLLIIVVAGVWAYHRATRIGTLKSFMFAGLLIGLAAVYKHTGIYLVTMVIICWIIQRRDHRKHLVLLLTVGMVIMLYVLGMTIAYWHGDHDTFLQESLLQWQRTTGAQSSRGTLSSIGSYIKPLLNQYAVFIGTILVAGASVVLILMRLIQCSRQRSLEPIRERGVFLSWVLASIFCFGVIDLKFPSYFDLLLVPMYVYVIVEFSTLMSSTRPRWQRNVALVLACVVLLLGPTAFYLRILSRGDNALAATATYASTELPHNALVLTEETIGAEIPQPYCTFSEASRCASKAQYLITYQSSTEELSTDQTFQRLLRHATLLWENTGFKETIKVYRVNR